MADTKPEADEADAEQAQVPDADAPPVVSARNVPLNVHVALGSARDGIATVKVPLPLLSMPLPAAGAVVAIVEPEALSSSVPLIGLATVVGHGLATVTFSLPMNKPE